MALQDHPDYHIETERLNLTISYIKEAIKAAELGRVQHKEEIKQAYRDLDPGDASQSYVSIMLHTKLLDDIILKYQSLLKAQEKPYFARIDFIQKGEKEIEKFYIGKMSLFRPEKDHPLILDWRSPLASVYYEGRLGEVSYDSYEEKLYGDLLLKRQYTIDQAKLKGIMDIDITATDTFLQASLGENKDNRLKDIVSTIQSEQNAIIRADINKPLIVQGVAGSGKTTIALHRIAYLIYTYEKSFYPENFMIIAPNRLFLNYISEVLPELGADNVIQTTYTDLVFDLIGKKYKLINPDEKLIAIISHEKVKKVSNFVKAAEWKGSMECKEAMDAYICDIEQNFVPEEDFVLEGKVILSKTKIRKIFLNDYKYLPFYKRLEQVKKHLRHRLRTDKEQIFAEVEHFYDVKIDTIRKNEEETEERREKIVELLNKRDEILTRMKKSVTTLVKQYMDKFEKRDLFEYYLDFMAEEETLINYWQGEKNPELLTYICQATQSYFETKRIELEDLAPLLYLKHRVFGFETSLDIKYVVIDEAQDFSHFQFFALKEILKTDLFTILGDLSQGIHSYRSIKDWEYVLSGIFTRKSQYLELEQSYRTTIEIMNLANKVISQIPNEKLILAKPVVRHGEEPKLQLFEHKETLLESLEQKVKELTEEGYQSIAIIGKTPRECGHIQKMLEARKQIKTKLLEGKEEEYDHSIVVVPSYLAKGLEFDAVCLVTLADCYHLEELDLKLLYVAMTRALHHLYVFYQEGTLPEFLLK